MPKLPIEKMRLYLKKKQKTDLEVMLRVPVDGVGFFFKIWSGPPSHSLSFPRMFRYEETGDVLIIFNWHHVNDIKRFLLLRGLQLLLLLRIKKEKPKKNNLNLKKKPRELRLEKTVTRHLKRAPFSFKQFPVQLNHFLFSIWQLRIFFSSSFYLNVEKGASSVNAAIFTLSVIQFLL